MEPGLAARMTFGFWIELVMSESLQWRPISAAGRCLPFLLGGPGHARPRSSHWYLLRWVPAFLANPTRGPTATAGRLAQERETWRLSISF